MKKWNFILLIACLFYLETTSAQGNKFNSNYSFQDISFNAGIYTNTGNEYLKEGTNMRLDYGIFNVYGFGFRTGIEYISGIEEDLCSFGLPLRLSWRSSKDRRKPEERIASAIHSYILTPNPTPMDVIVPLLSLRFELDAGVTPSYLTGDPHYGKAWNSWDGDYEEGLIVKNRFCLTGDIGFRIMLRIWRINLMFNPEYHYQLTDNYEFRTTIANKDNPITRSYISINMGAGILF